MAMNLSVLHNVSYGIYVVGANDRGRPTGCIINTAIQITSQNPIFAISMNKNNYTHDVILRDKRFSLAVLSENTPAGIIRQFGFQSGKESDKFDGVRYQDIKGVPLAQENTCGGMLFDVISVTDMETHSVIFGRLVGTVAGDEKDPMTYAYYHAVIKGRAPKNAPTYQAAEEEAPKKTVWICDICGYRHEAEELPDDFRCPVCGADRSHFKKMTG